MSKLALIGTLNYNLYLTKEQFEKLSNYYKKIENDNEEETEEDKKYYGEYKLLSEENGMYKVLVRKKGELIKNVKSIKEVDKELLKYKNTSESNEDMFKNYALELVDEYNSSSDSDLKVSEITNLGFYNLKEIYDINDFVTDVKVYNLGFIFDLDILEGSYLKEAFLNKLSNENFIEGLLHDNYINRYFKLKRKNASKEENIRDLYFKQKIKEDNETKDYVDEIYRNNMIGLLNVLLMENSKIDDYNLRRHLFQNHINPKYSPIIPREVIEYVNKTYGLNKNKKRT